MFDECANDYDEPIKRADSKDYQVLLYNIGRAKVLHRASADVQCKISVVPSLKN